MMRFILLLLAASLPPLLSLDAQSLGYIIKGDTAQIQGKIRYDPLRPAEVEIRAGRDKQGVVYTADEVAEFGLRADGAVFKSFPVLLDGRYQRVFLERVEAGRLALYRLDDGRPAYYLLADTLVRLERDQYLEVIRNWNEACPGREKQYRVVRYRASSLALFVRDYNRENCRNLPFLSYGASVGYIRQALQLTDNAYPAVLPEASSLTASSLNYALFVDYPLWKLPGFSLVGEAGYNENEFTAELFSASLNQDVKIEMSNAYLTLGPKYVLNTRNFRPYFLLGGTLSRAIRSNSKMLQAHLEGSVITIEPVDQFVRIPDLSYGFAFGAGVQFFYTYRRFFALEFSGRQLTGSENFSLSEYGVKLKMNL